MVERKGNIPNLDFRQIAGPDPDELRLLETYADGGPRIWDAAFLFALVVRLEEKGLIAPVHGQGGAYAITPTGQAVLGDQAQH